MEIGKKIKFKKQNRKLNNMRDRQGHRAAKLILMLVLWVLLLPDYHALVRDNC